MNCGESIIEAAPHSWQIEEHEPEDLRQPDELAADAVGESLGCAP